MENDKKSKIHELETENAELSKKLGIAQDMSLELWQMYQKAAKRLHALESLLEERS